MFSRGVVTTFQFVVYVALAETTVFCLFDGNQKKVKPELYLIRQDNTIYTYSIKLSFSSMEPDRSKGS